LDNRKLVLSTYDKKEAIVKHNGYKERGIRVSLITRQKYTYPIYNVYVFTDNTGFLASTKPSIVKNPTSRKSGIVPLLLIVGLITGLHFAFKKDNTA